MTSPYRYICIMIKIKFQDRSIAFITLPNSWPTNVVESSSKCKTNERGDLTGRIFGNWKSELRKGVDECWITGRKWWFSIREYIKVALWRRYAFPALLPPRLIFYGTAETASLLSIYIYIWKERRDNIPS